MRSAITVALTGAGILFGAQPVWAQRSVAPVALVEDIRGTPAGVEFMGYVSAGRVIRLGPQDSIVLGYLTSCWRETITGGTVTIGMEQSEVQGGKVARTKVLCNGGRISLTPGQANQSAGTSFRAAYEVASDGSPVTIYGLSPIVEAPGGSALVIMRTDRLGEYLIAKMPTRRGKQRTFLDLATQKKVLSAGGIYRATIGAQEIVFTVAADAKAHGVPIISRLLRFPDAN